VKDRSRIGDPKTTAGLAPVIEILSAYKVENLVAKVISNGICR